MKNLLKLPLLILALMLVVSCGDSKKEKEEEKKLSPVEMATKVAELECESELARIAGDSEKAEKIDQESNDIMQELRKMLGDDPDDEVEASCEEAYTKAMKKCGEKINEMAASDGKKLAELECDREIASLEDDSDKLEKLEEQLTKMYEERKKKWGDEEDEEIIDAFQEAYNNAWENCEEKIAEVLIVLLKKLAKLECELEKEYSSEVEKELLDLQDIVIQKINEGAIYDDIMDEAVYAYERAKSNCGYNNFDSDEKRAMEAVEAPAEEVFFTELLVDGKSSWDMNTTISGPNWEIYYYSVWIDGDFRSLYEGEIPWQEIVEGNTYKVYYSPRNWVEDYENGGFQTENFIIRIELLDD